MLRRDHQGAGARVGTRALRGRALRVAAIVAAGHLTTACVVPSSMHVANGTSPEKSDINVRFRTTYYFRVFDFCWSTNASIGPSTYKQIVPETDTLYRYRMTGKASALGNQIKFESGTLDKNKIDPFGADVVYNEDINGYVYRSAEDAKQEAEVLARRRLEAAQRRQALADFNTLADMLKAAEESQAAEDAKAAKATEAENTEEAEPEHEAETEKEGDATPPATAPSAPSTATTPVTSAPLPPATDGAGTVANPSGDGASTGVGKTTTAPKTDSPPKTDSAPKTVEAKSSARIALLKDAMKTALDMYLETYRRPVDADTLKTINGLKKDIQDLGVDVPKQIGVLRKDVDKQITELKAQVEELGGDVADLKKPPPAETDAVNALRVDLEKQVNDLKTKVAALDKKAISELDAFCAIDQVRRRGFQIMGPEGMRNFDQDSRLIMAMHSSAKPLIDTLNEYSGRLLQPQVNPAEQLLPLAREITTIVKTQRALDGAALDLARDATDKPDVDAVFDRAAEAFTPEAK